MRYSNQVKSINRQNINAHTLLKVLSLGDREIEAGKVKPIADVMRRLRSKHEGLIHSHLSFPRKREPS
jgi:hypothetical protein